MKRIIFMGTPDFSVPILNALIEANYEIGLVVTQPDRPKGRKKIITPPPVKIAAEKHGIPVFQPEKLKQDFQELIDFQPDLIITAAYGQLLPKEILELPTYGCINVHASLLPELRGGAPIHYAILEGKEETGITIMYMVEKLDAGDILTQTKVPIAHDDHVGTLHDKLAKAGATLLLDTLPRLFAKEITPLAQNDMEATFAANIKRDQEKIDWTKSSIEIYNQIRGLHPWPVAFTTVNGQVWKIWWGQKINQVIDETAPGIVIDIQEDYFIVSCGDQRGIKVTEIQPAGKKRMAVKDYLKGSGNRLTIGTQLGE